MLRFLVWISLALVLTACGSAGPVPIGDIVSTPLATSGTDWTLRFTQSGGFAGIMRTMEIRGDGQVTVVDERAGKQSTIQLNAEQLAELRTLADTSVFKPASGPSVCADCFVYTIEFQTTMGKPFSAQVDDTTLESSGLSELVQFLRNIMDDALKS